MAHKEGSELPVEGMEKDGDDKAEETKSTEKTVPEYEAPGENRSVDDEDKQEVLTNVVSECLGAADAQPEADLETDMRETSAVENVMEMAEEEKDVSGSKEECDETPAVEETSSQGASVEVAMPELPKVKCSGNVALLWC